MCSPLLYIQYSTFGKCVNHLKASTINDLAVECSGSPCENRAMWVANGGTTVDNTVCKRWFKRL